MLHNDDKFFGEYIHAYSREMAIDDGCLVDVSDMAREAGFNVPVAVTIAVWDKYIEWSHEDTDKQTVQDTNGRCWDVLWMLRMACGRKVSDRVLYKLYVVPRNGKSTKARLTTLKAIISAGDNGEPVITIMSPTED